MMSPSNLNIVSINIHSIRNKCDILEAEIARLGKVSVVIVSETWIQTGTESFYGLRGFSSYHETRADGYGGLSVYVDENPRHTLLRQVSVQAVHLITLRVYSKKVIAIY